MSALSREQKACFADAMFRRRELSWQHIKSAPRHGLGFEKIARNSIRASMPKFITEEVKHFLAFRFEGMRAMVGFRDLEIFYVLWFDHDFTLYKH